MKSLSATVLLLCTVLPAQASRPEATKAPVGVDPGRQGQLGEAVQVVRVFGDGVLIDAVEPQGCQVAWHRGDVDAFEDSPEDGGVMAIGLIRRRIVLIIKRPVGDKPYFVVSEAVSCRL